MTDRKERILSAHFGLCLMSNWFIDFWMKSVCSTLWRNQRRKYPLCREWTFLLCGKWLSSDDQIPGAGSVVVDSTVGSWGAAEADSVDWAWGWLLFFFAFLCFLFFLEAFLLGSSTRGVGSRSINEVQEEITFGMSLCSDGGEIVLVELSQLVV